MNLAEVQKKMVPGAEAAIAETLDYHEATQAFALTLVETAIKACNGVQNRAAMKLGTTPALISRVVNGKLLRRGRKPKANQTESV